MFPWDVENRGVLSGATQPLVYECWGAVGLRRWRLVGEEEGNTHLLGGDMTFSGQVRRCESFIGNIYLLHPLLSFLFICMLTEIYATQKKEKKKVTSL